MKAMVSRLLVRTLGGMSLLYYFPGEAELVLWHAYVVPNAL